jgi:hypothetical protein
MSEKNRQIILQNVRLSFANLFRPQKFVDAQAGTERWTYNTNLLIPKKLETGEPNPQIAILRDAMREVIVARWGQTPPNIPPERRCVRDGEPVNPDTDQPTPLYEGFEGHVFVSANRAVDGPESPNPLQLLGPKKTAKGPDGKPAFPRLTEADGMLYSGAYVDAIITIYAFDGSKLNVPHRVNASLEAVKFKAHGDAFGAAPVDADNLFDEEPDDNGFDEPSTTSSATDDLLG